MGRVRHLRGLARMPPPTARSILGKNSDREPNEAHELITRPCGRARRRSQLRCTHIEIPQVRRTHGRPARQAVLDLGRRDGRQRAGRGDRQRGGVHQGEAEKAEPGLIGMDSLRLGLERAGTAEEAVEVITDLLAAYGQAGQAGHTHDFIRQQLPRRRPPEAWVLETVGREWVAQRVTDVVDLQRSHPGPRRVGLRGVHGVRVSDRSDFLYTRFSDSAARQCRTSDTLAASRGSMTWTRPCACCATTGRRPRLGAGTGGHRADGVCARRVRADPGGAVDRVDGRAPDGRRGHGVADRHLGTVHVGVQARLARRWPARRARARERFDAASTWWRHELLHRETLRKLPAADRGLRAGPRRPPA